MACQIKFQVQVQAVLILLHKVKDIPTFENNSCDHNNVFRLIACLQDFILHFHLDMSFVMFILSKYVSLSTCNILCCHLDAFLSLSLSLQICMIRIFYLII